jgi:hypothetical protein
LAFLVACLWFLLTHGLLVTTRLVSRDIQSPFLVDEFVLMLNGESEMLVSVSLKMSSLIYSSLGSNLSVAYSVCFTSLVSHANHLPFPQLWVG